MSVYVTFDRPVQPMSMVLEPMPVESDEVAFCWDVKEDQAESPKHAGGAARSTFRGPLVEGQCRVSFQLKGCRGLGVAVLDTGFPWMLLDTKFAARCGVLLDTDNMASIQGIGDEPNMVPTAKVEFAVQSSVGPPFICHGTVGVCKLPKGLDMLIGTDVLIAGDFSLNGRTASWSWVIDSRDLGAPLRPSMR